MEAMEALETRRSIRAYRDEVVDDAVLQRIAQAGLMAPSGNDCQGTVIVAVTDPSVRDTLSRLNAQIRGADNDPFYGAPAVLAVLADTSCSNYLFDGALVMGNLMNAARAEGLGSCWVAKAKEQFDTDEGRALLRQWGIPEGYEGIGNCIIGQSAEGEPAPSPRREGRLVFV